MTKRTGSRIWLGLALLTLAVSLLAGPPSALADTSNESAQSGDQAKKEKQDPATQKSDVSDSDKGNHKEQDVFDGRRSTQIQCAPVKESH